MGPAADSPSNTHSPQYRRNSNLSSPWSDIVRGDSEAVLVVPSPSPATISSSETADRSPSKVSVENPAAGPSDSVGPSVVSLPVPDSGDQGCSGNAAPAVDPAGRGKKPAWSKPSNGFEGPPVMGGILWPPLSESTKASLKSSSSESLQSVSDGSISAPPAPVIPSPPPNPIADFGNPSSSSNHARQKSMNRVGGSSSSALANGGPSNPPSTSAETPQVASNKPIASESSPRNASNKNSSNWDNGSKATGFTSQHHGGNDHRRTYGSSKRGNNSGRGGGGNHNSYGYRRDLDHGSNEWNPDRNFSSRDVQMQQQPHPRPVPRPYPRPFPPSVAPYISPSVRPFGSPMYPDMRAPFFYVSPPLPPESLRGMPLVAPNTSMFLEAQFRFSIARQIEYYFSSENLCKDMYLRKNMDNEGWVPITLIAGFNRVTQLVNQFQHMLDIKVSNQFILDAVQTSTIVEVQGDRMRRRNDWMNWLPFPPINQSSTVDGSNNGMRVASPSEMVLGRSSSGEFSTQTQGRAPNGEGARQITAHGGSGGSDQSVSLLEAQ